MRKYNTYPLLTLLSCVVLWCVADLQAEPTGVDQATQVNVVSANSAGSGTASIPVRLENARGEQLANAVGHYARARSLIQAAIREFDKGYRLANPESLFDPHEWRHTLLDRAEELERVLDPQPRVTRGGVRFDPDPRLLSDK